MLFRIVEKMMLQTGTDRIAELLVKNGLKGTLPKLRKKLCVGLCFERARL
jgi:hypothetical protein